MRILIVTTKQPSSNPRMRKASDALAAAGHKVHVLYAYNAEWATEADEKILAEASWTFERVGGDPIVQRTSYFISRAVRKFYGFFGFEERAMCRSFGAYLRKGVAWNPDIVIGHNPGTLELLKVFKSRLKIPVFFDAEDYHRGELSSTARDSELVARLEGRVLPQLTAITAASPLIANAYKRLFPNVPVLSVENAFPRKLQPAKPSHPLKAHEPLRMIWFSQVVGLDRGLLEFMKGMALAVDIPIELNIVGLCHDAVKQVLLNEVGIVHHRLSFLPPVAEDSLFKLVADHEIGLALEPGSSENNDMALSNKVLTYSLCGCFMLLSKTAAQCEFLESHPQTGRLIELKDSGDIASAVRYVFENREVIFEKRLAAWELAHVDMNWETEGKKLVEWIERMTVLPNFP
jgi:glycosyltransferase involved in cell wall biosynthesis